MNATSDLPSIADSPPTEEAPTIHALFAAYTDYLAAVVAWRAASAAWDYGNWLIPSDEATAAQQACANAALRRTLAQSRWQDVEHAYLRGLGGQG